MKHGVGRVNAAPSGLADFETKIDIGISNRCMHSIEPTNAEKIVAPHRQARPGKRGNVAHGLRQIEMFCRIRRALMKCRAD